MKIDFIYRQSIWNLPQTDLETLKKLDENALRFLLGLCAERDSVRLAEKLGLDGEKSAKAIVALTDAGLITDGKVLLRPSEETPHYTGEEIDRIFTEKTGMRSLIDECAKIAGKLFNPTEINKIVALSDYLRLSDEYILLLFSFCASEGKKSVAYIEKTAYGLVNDGIDTVEMLVRQIEKRREFRSLESRIRRLLGCGDRALTAKEKEYFEKWTGSDGWNFSFEMVEAAYETTVDTIGKKSMPYTDKILSGWNESGIRTLDAVRQNAEQHKAQKMTSGSSFATDDFFEAALRRSYAQSEKEKEKENIKNT